MQLDAFDYHLPEHLIAQEPRVDRSGSRLLVVDRSAPHAPDHARFHDIVELVSPGDVIVVNESRVMPARLFAFRETGGQVELLVSEVTSDTEFVAIGSPLKRLKPGDTLQGEGGCFSCEIIERVGGREICVRVTSGGSVMDLLNRHGHMPLPPYITRSDDKTDRERYQTVYARTDGSVAAPTAGLHFDDAVLDALASRGVRVCSVVLHVGLGTFLPLEHDAVEENRLHAERYAVSTATLNAIAQTRRDGGKVIAVGTTTTRVLETLADEIAAGSIDSDRSGATDLFVYPGYDFRVVDGLITNFHLPCSSLLLLVSAFLGREATLQCYREAVEKEYWFYSYGDAMFIR